MSGTKHDSNKPPMELLPSLSLEEIAKVLDYGRQKYDAWNWSKGFAWGRLIGAAYRHLGAFQRGEDVDPETKISHIAHLACTALFLLEHQLRELGVDDRHKWGYNKKHEDEGNNRTIPTEQTKLVEPENSKERKSKAKLPRWSCGCLVGPGWGLDDDEDAVCSLHKSHGMDKTY